MQGKFFSFDLAFGIALFLCNNSASGITVNLPAIQDNTLYGDPNGSLSNGSGPVLFAGVSGGGLLQRGLLQFDIIGELPTGATITSATLALYLSRESNVSISENIQLHRVEAAWGEGTSVAPMGGGGGGPATAGDATWTHRINPNDAWTTAGGDFSGTVSASQSVLGIGFHSWGSTAQMISDVQDWLDDPGANFGWLLLGNESFSQTSKRFDSRENPVVANRPVLTIEYEGGGPTADFTHNGFVDGEDLAIWEAAYAVDDGGDTDEDGDTDGVDFLNWQQQYTGPPEIFTVPELDCARLLLIAAALASGGRYRL
jgi:hypothetical protein